MASAEMLDLVGGFNGERNTSVRVRTVPSSSDAVGLNDWRGPVPRKYLCFRVRAQYRAREDLASFVPDSEGRQEGLRQW